MKPYLTICGAEVHFETLFPSGTYLVTAYAPDGSKHDQIICDDYTDALAYRRAFIGIAKELRLKHDGDCYGYFVRCKSGVTL